MNTYKVLGMKECRKKYNPIELTQYMNIYNLPCIVKLKDGEYEKFINWYESLEQAYHHKELLERGLVEEPI